MDELEALKLLRGEQPAISEVEDTPKTKKDEYNVYIAGAICGFLLFVIGFLFILHPIDRLNLNLAIFDSYIITTKIAGSQQEITVDGNIIYTDDVYYEDAGDGVIYMYEKRADGKWYRSAQKSVGDGADTSWLIRILDKNNYTREFLPWKPMEFHGSILGLNNVRTQVMSSGRCIISGEKKVYNGLYDLIYYATIEISGYGLIHLELPEEYIIVK